MTTADERAARLDELNEAAIRDHARNILDHGLGGPGSALHRPYRPGGGSLLEDLRRNAEAVYGDAGAGRRAARP